MNEPLDHIIAADFDVISWQPEPYEVAGTVSELSRVRVTKEFDGLIKGTSVAELLMAGNERGAGYVASEVFNGTIDGRQGSVIIQHWGLAEGEDAASSGHIIPGSGTQELAGINGKAVYGQDAAGQHTLELRVSFPPAETAAAPADADDPGNDGDDDGSAL